MNPFRALILAAALLFAVYIVWPTNRNPNDDGRDFDVADAPRSRDNLAGQGDGKSAVVFTDESRQGQGQTLASPEPTPSGTNPASKDDSDSETTNEQQKDYEKDVAKTNKPNTNASVGEFPTSAAAPAGSAKVEELAEHWNHRTGPYYSEGKSTFEYHDGPPVPAWWEVAQAETSFPNCDYYALKNVFDSGAFEEWEKLREDEANARRAALKDPASFEPPPVLPQLYDVFLLNTELDILELRLNELDPVVDKFVLVDSNFTFTNIPKASLITPELLLDPRFAKFVKKMVHVVLPELKGDDTWGRERYSRTTSLQKAVEILNPYPGDLFLTGDLDEIPRGSVLNRLKRCKGWKSPRTLRTHFFYYSFESRADFDWPGPSIHRHYPKDHRLYADAEQIRATVERGPSGEMNAGWHCSWCLQSLEAFARKMESYSHEEHNTEHYKDPRHVLSSILLRKDLIDRDGHNYLALRVPVSDKDLRGGDESLIDMPSWLAIHRPKHLIHFWDRWTWTYTQGYDPEEVVRSNHSEFEEFERKQREQWAREDEERRKWEEEEKKRHEAASSSAVLTTATPLPTVEETVDVVDAGKSATTESSAEGAEAQVKEADVGKAEGGDEDEQEVPLDLDEKKDGEAVATKTKQALEATKLATKAASDVTAPPKAPESKDVAGKPKAAGRKFFKQPANATKTAAAAANPASKEPAKYAVIPAKMNTVPAGAQATTGGPEVTESVAIASEAKETQATPKRR